MMDDVITVEMVRDNADIDPSLTEDQRLALRSIPDEKLKAAIDAAFARYAPMWFALLENVAFDAIHYLLSDALQTCRHCGETIVLVNDVWVNPEGTYNELLWHETCPEHDDYPQDHEPEWPWTATPASG